MNGNEYICFIDIKESLMTHKSVQTQFKKNRNKEKKIIIKDIHKSIGT